MINYHRYFPVCRFFIAAVLLLAGGLKAYQLATVPILGEGLLHDRWFNIFVVEFELFFAVWLFFGQLLKWTRLASILLFTVFSAVSFYKAVTGESSCGCFGSVQVNPWITMGFDLFIVLLLLFCRPKEQAAFSVRKIVAAGAVWIFLTLPVLPFLLPVEVSEFGDLGTVTAENNGKKTVALMPKRWHNKPIPFLPYLQSDTVDSKILLTGDWTIVLYRTNCPKCSRLLSELTAKNTENIVYIEVPLNGKTAGKRYNYESFDERGADSGLSVLPFRKMMVY